MLFASISKQLVPCTYHGVRDSGILLGNQTLYLLVMHAFKQTYIFLVITLNSTREVSTYVVYTGATKY